MDDTLVGHAISILADCIQGFHLSPPARLLSAKLRHALCGGTAFFKGPLGFPLHHQGRRFVSFGATFKPMADFNRSQGFNGTCAPFAYIAGCTPEARRGLMNASRFWLAANSLALLCLIAAIIYRFRRVTEPFNTLRLAMICFACSVPLYVTRAKGGIRRGIKISLSPHHSNCLLSAFDVIYPSYTFSL